MSQITLAPLYCFTFANDEAFLMIDRRGQYLGTDEFDQISFWSSKEEAIGFQLAINSNPENQLQLQLMELIPQFNPIR